MNHRYVLTTGATFAAIAVIMGAFAAHALKPKLSPDQLDVFQTGVKYLMYHGLAILFLFVLIGQDLENRSLVFVYRFFTLGAVLFSGSLFLLSTRHVSGLQVWKWLGPVTPIGGTLLIIGWFLLIWISIRPKNR